jgi:hypothetical protein
MIGGESERQCVSRLWSAPILAATLLLWSALIGISITVLGLRSESLSIVAALTAR